MSIKQQIDQDLKTALLAGDKALVTTLRGLKSAILYVEVATHKRDTGLSDEDVVIALRKEAKKRQESAELYKQGANLEKAEAELTEYKVIEAYLPAQMTDEALATLVDWAISEIPDVSPRSLGKVIGRVKELTKGQADGGRIAQLVKERLK
jgi:uncharacterized protein